MKVNIKKIFQILIIFTYLIVSANSQTQTINLNNLDESIQCFHLEKMTFGEKEEIIYELINNNLYKILFIQFQAVQSAFIYKSDIIDSNLIISGKKEDNNLDNFYFKIEKSIEKYFIKVEFSHSDVNKFKMCFNLFDAKENSFKSIPGKSQKIATYDIINSGKFPLFLNDNLTSFNALRINKKYEEYFKISSILVNAKIDNFEEKEINLDINEFFNNEEYQYIIWKFDFNKGVKIKEILIEVNLNLIKYEEGKNKIEIELIKNQEIHYEYKIYASKIEYIPKIYFIDLKKNIFEKDLDILCFSNIFNDLIYISDSYNIHKENIDNIDKKFFVLNKNYFKMERYEYLNINPSLLFIIIEENSIFRTMNLIYSFIFAGSSHDIYHYHEDITKKELFKNGKYVINKEKCSSFYLINYFSDFDVEYLMEYEPIMGNATIYYTNQLNNAEELPDYLDKINSYPLQYNNISIITESYAFFKISCGQGANSILHYLNFYKKNGLNDVIYFKNQKALIYLQKDQTHSFTFDSDILNEKFSMRIRILKKDEGMFNIEINYKNTIYKTLNENNFLELKHEKGENPIIYISLKEVTESKKKEKGVILEIIKNLDIDNNLIEIKNNNIFNSILPSNKFLFTEYDKKDSDRINLIIYNVENDDANICIHRGAGIYPYLIKPTCTDEDLINLKKSESISLSYENPFNNNGLINFNSDNKFYISLSSNRDIKYDFVYEKFSEFNQNTEYKNLDFSGKEIVQLNNNQRYPYIYYQINICQDFSNIFQFDSGKPILFQYYFEDKKNEIILNDIKTDIYKSYKFKNNESKKPNIIFTKSDSIKGKFKYTFSSVSNFNFNEQFSKEIKLEKNIDKITLHFETPFQGNLIIYCLFIISDLDKYNNLCPVIDLFENLKNNIESQNKYGNKLIKKELYADENTRTLDIEIETKELFGINRKDVKLYVINTLKMINIDMFYKPYNFRSNFKDNFTEKEDELNATKILVAIICFIILFFFIFILYRNYKRKRLINDINFDQKKIQLNEDVNESNKLI